MIPKLSPIKHPRLLPTHPQYYGELQATKQIPKIRKVSLNLTNYRTIDPFGYSQMINCTSQRRETEAKLLQLTMLQNPVTPRITPRPSLMYHYTSPRKTEPVLASGKRHHKYFSNPNKWGAHIYIFVQISKPHNALTPKVGEY